MDIKDKIKSLLRQTVLDFVNGDFQEIQAKLIEQLTINDIKRELDYWGSLTIPPDFAYENVDYYKYDDGSGYALEFYLWIDNQQSDLTLSCEAILDQNDNILSFTIEDLHVL
ncbi:hypothetical protein CN689_22365 [Peribacillus butanolivorans]|uniref:DUF7668 domain-containing protein n=1 Tax=Peribacillus butanolivorans TaxID=421767 RepID=A0AAX0RWV1_9BACI|nr:hypothetical protein [Peribacillus butanolivorans]PEJ28302.1 hypothetical protein CN689_22365 [Peribacillus butanolivorans]